MYEQANYQYANGSTARTCPTGAAVPQKHPHYRDVTPGNSRAYRIIAVGVHQGVVIIFREDGYSFEGRELYFFAKNYTLKTGTRAATELRHRPPARIGKDAANRRTKRTTR